MKYHFCEIFRINWNVLEFYIHEGEHAYEKIIYEVLCCSFILFYGVQYSLFTILCRG